MRDALRTRLLALGATEDDIGRAEKSGFLPLLALERRLLPGPRKYDVVQLAAEAGLDVDWLRRVWRAAGLPDVPAGIPAFSERDLDAAREVARQAAMWGTDLDLLLQQVRVTSSATARIAAVEAEVIAGFVQRMRDDGLSDEDIALALISTDAIESLEVLLTYSLRLQLRSETWRRLALQFDPDIAVGVGFADLAGYTELSTGLDPEALSQLLSRWEAIAFDTVVAHGARVVKTIGDEVMFVGLPAEVLSSAVTLRTIVSDAGLPAVRVGVAAGPVIAREGDYYGPVVNLASRLTDIAPANSVLAPGSMRAQVPAGTFVFVPYGEHVLRGIGPTEIWAVEAIG
jgi:adenylate cyclase